MFVNEVVEWQKVRQRALFGESPKESKAWNETPLVAAFEGAEVVTTDMCMFGLCHPETNQPVRKRTVLKGTPEVCRAVHRTCDGKHTHARVIGRVRIPTRRGKPRSMIMSEWAGGYTPAFAQAILDGAKEYFRDWKDPVATGSGGSSGSNATCSVFPVDEISREPERAAEEMFSPADVDAEPGN